MGGGGFMHDANRIIRQNKALIKYKDRWSRRESDTHVDQSLKDVPFRPLDEAQRMKIKIESAQLEKRNRYRLAKIIVLSIITTAALILLLNSWAMAS